MIRRRLARLLLRILGPELALEIKRVAEAEAHHAGAVALTIAETKLSAAVTALTQQDIETLRLLTAYAEETGQKMAVMLKTLSARSDALPGEAPPEHVTKH